MSCIFEPKYYVRSSNYWYSKSNSNMVLFTVKDKIDNFTYERTYYSSKDYCAVSHLHIS